MLSGLALTFRVITIKNTLWMITKNRKETQNGDIKGRITKLTHEKLNQFLSSPVQEFIRFIEL